MADGRLPGVAVGIDKAGQDDHAGCVDDLGIGRVLVGTDPVDAPVDQEQVAGEIADRRVHADDRTATDEQGPLGHVLLLLSVDDDRN